MSSTTNVTELWESACRHVQLVLHADTYSRWFAIIQPVALENDVITLSVDNDFCQKWIEDNYQSLILEALKSAGASPSIKVKFTISAMDIPEEPKVDAKASDSSTKISRARKAHAANLNANYTFDEFIIAPCNSFAAAAAKAVANAPGSSYNPLFIYGETALGKTHLMQAIGHEIAKKDHNAVVRYVTTEALLNEYVDAMIRKDTVEFRRRYRSVDVLMIDDIHFLVGKNTLQEEFFHTFNELHNARKQIILCSDRPAKDLQGLEQRLVSRFEWGLVTSLERPDFETRLAILRYKQSHTKVKLSDELLTFIAQNITSNIRRLEGALVRAISYSSLMGTEYTVETLRVHLRDLLEQERQPDLTADTIQKAVADQFDVRMTDMTSKRRPACVAVPRQVAMFLCRRLTRASLPEIGQTFGKTHATILHACKTVRGRMDVDQAFNTRVQDITRKLGRDPLTVLKD